MFPDSRPWGQFRLGLPAQSFDFATIWCSVQSILKLSYGWLEHDPVNFSHHSDQMSRARVGIYRANICEWCREWCLSIKRIWCCLHVWICTPGTLPPHAIHCLVYTIICTQIHKYTNIYVYTCMYRCAPCHLIQCRTTMSTQLQVPPMCHIYMLFSLEYVESNTVLIVVWLYKVSQVGGGSRHWGRMELGLLGDLFWRRMGIFLKAA